MPDSVLPAEKLPARPGATSTVPACHQDHQASSANPVLLWPSLPLASGALLLLPMPVSLLPAEKLPAHPGATSTAPPVSLSSLPHPSVRLSAWQPYHEAPLQASRGQILDLPRPSCWPRCSPLQQPQLLLPHLHSSPERLSDPPLLTSSSPVRRQAHRASFEHPALLSPSHRFAFEGLLQLLMLSSLRTEAWHHAPREVTSVEPASLLHHHPPSFAVAWSALTAAPALPTGMMSELLLVLPIGE